jgi:hypothetical protein
MEEFETEHLAARPLGGDEHGWQRPVTDGEHPVDAAYEWVTKGECVGPDLMFPIALASLADITVNMAQALVAKAQAEDPDNWLALLRSYWQTPAQREAE